MIQRDVFPPQPALAADDIFWNPLGSSRARDESFCETRARR
jgi:hypothetical protein